jgi:hypothetical protein
MPNVQIEKVEKLAMLACEATGGTWEICPSKQKWREVVVAVLDAIKKVDNAQRPD